MTLEKLGKDAKDGEGTEAMGGHIGKGVGLAREGQNKVWVH